MSDTYYWDSCVFLSYINGVVDRLPILDDYLSRARTGDCQIVTSTWSITEVAFEVSERGTKTLSQEIERKIDLFWADRSAIKLVEVHPLLQREARRLMREAIPNGWSLKPVDAVHLATSISDSVKASAFHTYSNDLHKYQALINIPISVPTPRQYVLPITTSPGP